jgi:succinate dehydrogenase / fumarate reductase iron-sulfur subunit
MVRIANIEMHPKDVLDRRPLLGDGPTRLLQHHKVLHRGCPEHIKITDNAIIPLKERMDDEYFDPIRWLMGRIKPRTKNAASD